MAAIRDHRRAVSAAVLLCSIAAVVFTLAAPRAYACEVDDDLDAVAEGILNADEVAGSRGATKSMSCKLLVPGPHLRVTARRTPTAADIARANEIRARTRQALAKYEDYRAALQDGYEIRFPNLALKRYHFSNSANGRASMQAFDPSRPSVAALREGSRRLPARGRDVHRAAGRRRSRARPAISDQRRALAPPHEFLPRIRHANPPEDGARSPLRAGRVDFDGGGMRCGRRHVQAGRVRLDDPCRPRRFRRERLTRFGSPQLPRRSGLLLTDRVGTLGKSDMWVWRASQSSAAVRRPKTTVARPGRG
jgi:hypothetical protein